MHCPLTVLKFIQYQDGRNQLVKKDDTIPFYIYKLNRALTLEYEIIINSTLEKLCTVPWLSSSLFYIKMEEIS